MLPNMPTFMPLCSHLLHLFKGWGDGAQHPCLAQGLGTHLPQLKDFSVFGLCGFANLQARLGVPSNNSLSSTFGQSSNCPTHCRHRQKSLPTPSQTSLQISISLGYLVTHSFQSTFTYIVLSSLQNRSV